jgi:hypothetical protein
MDLNIDNYLKDWFKGNIRGSNARLLYNGNLLGSKDEINLNDIINSNSESEIKLFSEDETQAHLNNFKFYNSDIKKDKIFFMHIPKTAGSSLNKMLASNFIKRNTQLHIETDRKNNYKNVDLTNLKMVSGHIHLYDIIKNFNLNNFLRITVLRNPYEQLISHINWLRFVGSKPNGKFFKAHSEPIREVALKTKEINFTNTTEVERFITQMPPIGNRLFNNCQTRFLLNKKKPTIDKGSAQEAIKTLHYFDLIGTVENLDTFMEKIQEKMYWEKDKKIIKSNALNNKYKLDKNSGKLKNILKPLFQEDQIIYDYVLSNKSLNFI